MIHGTCYICGDGTFIFCVVVVVCLCAMCCYCLCVILLFVWFSNCYCVFLFALRRLKCESWPPTGVRKLVESGVHRKYAALSPSANRGTGVPQCAPRGLYPLVKAATKERGNMCIYMYIYI